MIRRWARFVVIAILYAACAHLTPLPGLISGPGIPANTYCARVDAAGRCDVYRSAQPSKAELVAMRDRLGIRSVLKLNSAIEGRDEAPEGVEIIEHPMSSVLGPTAGQADQICEDIDAAPKPLDIHCTEGRERTGWAIERCLRMRQRTMPKPGADAMYNEWIAYGMRPWLASGLIEDFDRATGYARAGAR